MNHSSFQSTPVFKDTPASSPFTLRWCSTHPSQLWLLCWGSGWPGGCPGWTEPRRPHAPTRAPAQVFGGISPRRCRDPGWSSRRAAGQGSAPHWGNVVHPSAGLNRSSICGSLLCLRDQEDKHTPFYKSITHIYNIYEYQLTKLWLSWNAQSVGDLPELVFTMLLIPE